MTKHETHFDDCGCKSERYEEIIKALMEALEEVKDYVNDHGCGCCSDEKVGKNKRVKEALALIKEDKQL